MDVHEALQAICSTGKGRCWYCDVKLPPAGDAIRQGWDVQRVEHQPVASIILVCPTCLHLKTELGEDGFMRSLSLRMTSVTC
jgi:hypothetical protein